MDMSAGMSAPPPGARVIEEPRTLHLKVRVELADVWRGGEKTIPVRGTHTLRVPLTHKEVVFERDEADFAPWDEITVSLVDKPNPKLRRRKMYDLETFVAVRKIKEDQTIRVQTHDGYVDVAWTAEKGEHAARELDKGFFMYERGLPKPDGTRGRLWVRLYETDDPADAKAGEQATTEATASKAEAEMATAAEWWNNGSGEEEAVEVVRMGDLLKKVGG